MLALENTATGRFVATWALEDTAQACSGAVSKHSPGLLGIHLQGLLQAIAQACSGATWALEDMAQACSGATRALRNTAQATSVGTLTFWPSKPCQLLTLTTMWVSTPTIDVETLAVAVGW